MRATSAMRVLFIVGFGPIVRNATPSRKLYADELGLSFKEEPGGYLHTEALPDAKTFALWPLTEAAQSCFGSNARPEDISVPQAWLEFEVDVIEKATEAIELSGHRRVVARVLASPRVHQLPPEGLQAFKSALLVSALQT